LVPGGFTVWRRSWFQKNHPLGSVWYHSVP
jgi:hypothetical protein